MKRFIVLALSFTTLFLAASMAYSQNTQVTSRVIWDSNETLQPGVLHGWVLGPVSANRGYVVEVTPLDTNPSLLTDGENVKAFVEPEFSAGEGVWSDVLRVQLLPETAAALKANLRVYTLERRK